MTRYFNAGDKVKPQPPISRSRVEPVDIPAPPNTVPEAKAYRLELIAQEKEKRLLSVDDQLVRFTKILLQLGEDTKQNINNRLAARAVELKADIKAKSVKAVSEVSALDDVDLINHFKW